MKQKINYLTNERFKYKFNSFFELANYGIQIAKEKMAIEERVTLNIILEELEKLPDTIQKTT